jgi:hypothetical protein
MRTAWVCSGVSSIKHMTIIQARSLCRTATSTVTDYYYSCQQQHKLTYQLRQHNQIIQKNHRTSSISISISITGSRRNSVWHAGLIEESIADEIIDEIKFERIQIVKLIDEELSSSLPSSSSSWLSNKNNNNYTNNNQKENYYHSNDLLTSAAQAPQPQPQSTVQEVMSIILKRGQNILQLRQRYKNLTGDDHEDVSENNNKIDSSNNNTFNDSIAVQTMKNY